MATGEEVKVLGYWSSPYALRVKWALKLKAVEFDYMEEDLTNKSALLLQLNPVHKKIPVLLHNGKPVAESLVIMEYVDETWKQNPLLPQHPHQRAIARFWAKFVDEKEGEEQEKAAKEAREHLKTLESGLEEGKPFFGGESIGFVDIAAAWIGVWGEITGEIVGIKLVDEEAMPLLTACFQAVLQTPLLKECLPPRAELLEHSKRFRQKLMAAAAAST
ncbi:glutathione S-transferase U7-like isoform X2 [Diospyros lotus]|uniref:glutathione S-transferase U7-like isoform X2 n=1 Tax=Diospyros lotus TaxID=55363 RepID=UPI0022538932|nr:glutathione S-transferase U7-like isoform X2 [Diospyros lotus]